MKAFREGRKDTRYVEGQNVAMEYRWADNRIDRIARRSQTGLSSAAKPRCAGAELSADCAFSETLSQDYPHGQQVRQPAVAAR